MDIEIREIHERTPRLIKQLTEIWERSVKATHLFLSDRERGEIKKQVPQALYDVAHLVLAEGEGPIAFMGVAGEKIEMLFIMPEERGRGLGKRLIQYGIDHYAVRTVSVNEQNPLAKGFYEHMGFQVCERRDRDEQGRPYPLLHMKRT